MRAQSDRPIPNSYWVRPGFLLAGEYPTMCAGEEEDRAMLRRFLDAGVSLFLDLTEWGELEPYAPLLSGLSPEAEHRRMPIRDFGTPTPEDMEHILDMVDAAMSEGRTVYVHCHGGIGRTGTVVGCHMARHGIRGKAALAEIARLRHGIPNSWIESPETPEQRRMVLRWHAGR